MDVELDNEHILTQVGNIRLAPDLVTSGRDVGTNKSQQYIISYCGLNDPLCASSFELF